MFCISFQRKLKTKIQGLMSVIIFFYTLLLCFFLKVCLEITGNYTLTNFFDIQYESYCGHYFKISSLTMNFHERIFYILQR